MTRQRTIAVLGLGLIGGSLARDLSARGARVIGYDRDREVLGRATSSGHVHVALDDSLHGLEEASWAVLAVPVGESPDLLRTIAPRARNLALITDVGSTKRSAADTARRLGLVQFVGSHPLTGDHRSGWDASRSGLFEGATVFVCPEPGTSGESADLALALWSSLGARPMLCSPDVHDERMAWVSHLPHLASSALSLAIGSGGFDVTDLGPGGHDATRLAAGSPALWRSIAIDNAKAIAGAIGVLEDELRHLRQALERRDGPALEEHLIRAAKWRSADVAG